MWRGMFSRSNLNHSSLHAEKVQQCIFSVKKGYHSHAEAKDDRNILNVVANFLLITNHLCCMANNKVPLQIKIIQ